ncbi:AAA family ATPase [Aquabacterium sp. A7-Y]|uniref:AAA family ATPase n=1 Tax=Aquabacterium sp. A7-Y TaxID=1349605 RepID=UPI00223E84D7|nr:AAA family ATPase [Aquabacterium sp. A7-Y]MCW7536244.1 AAA family ATPase [Aquabacterium sp. A7-Y]
MTIHDDNTLPPLTAREGAAADDAPVRFLDFNDAPPQAQPQRDFDAEREEIRAALLARLEPVLSTMFPAGKKRGGKFLIGDVLGSPGDSLEVVLDGEKAGLWTDRADGSGGDIFTLIGEHYGIDTQTHFAEVLQRACDLLGRAPTEPAAPVRRGPPVDELGPHTAKWDYLDADGKLIAVVYRYDPPGRRKEFRPYDVKRRKTAPPDPRPLYNQPGIAKSAVVVLAEGEKCADALIKMGFCATTAMHGANAPVDKTDWSPLAGKVVIIWPDRDKPGWEYAENAALAILQAGAVSCTILYPPEDKPEGWDVANAVAESFDVRGFIAHGERRSVRAAPAPLPSFTLGDLLDDDSPLPPDLIAPRVLTPGGMLVFGGAPKVGKSDFLLSWLAHMAGSAPFLGMRPHRALRVFYLQAEVQYDYLRERVKEIRLPASRVSAARTNLVATPQLRLILDDAGLAQVIPTITAAFRGERPDIIAIDPLRNVFDGGEAGGENDNDGMLFFLSQRVERLRDAVNPQAGIVLVHHTKKLGKKQFEEDPFQALAGASSLRGYYTTGMLLFRPDEASTARQVIFELRNGAAISPKDVDKIKGEWREIAASRRLVMQDHGARLDAERRRKRDVILQIIYDEAAAGRCYTTNQFAEAFEGKAGLGGERTIRQRISALSTQGYIKFFRNASDYGLPSPERTKFGYLCVEAMVLCVPLGEPDVATGELPLTELMVLPTHYKCRPTGAALPVENPEVWVYHDDETTLEVNDE